MMIITTSIEGGMSNAIMPDKVQNICAQINRPPTCLAGPETIRTSNYRVVVQFEISASRFWHPECVIILSMAKKKDLSPAAELQKETDNLVRQGDRTKKQIDKTIKAADELASKASKRKREDVNQAAARILRETIKD